MMSSISLLMSRPALEHVEAEARQPNVRPSLKSRWSAIALREQVVGVGQVLDAEAQVELAEALPSTTSPRVSRPCSMMSGSLVGADVRDAVAEVVARARAPRSRSPAHSAVTLKRFFDWPASGRSSEVCTVRCSGSQRDLRVDEGVVGVDEEAARPGRGGLELDAEVAGAVGVLERRDRLGAGDRRRARWARRSTCRRRWPPATLAAAAGTAPSARRRSG